MEGDLMDQLSAKPRALSLRKRLRVIVAALRQQWHQKTCGECQQQYWVEGRDYELIAVCDACESRLLDQMGADLERQWQQRQLKGVQ